jgi:hypothetical protein
MMMMMLMIMMLLVKENFNTGEGKLCPGELTLGKILPGKNSVPKLKNGGKISVPSGFEREKSTFGAKHRRILGLHFFLVDDKMKLKFPGKKTAGKILS